MKIEILLFDGFDELDALGPFEVLATAGMDVALVRNGSAAPVTASHGAVVTPQRPLSARPDLVIVPGGGWMDGSPQGVRAEAEGGELPALLARMHADGARIASVCTGAMLLAAAGLLRGRPATTHHGAIEDLRASGAEIVDARVVDDGDVLTAGGVTSGLDLAAHVVAQALGDEAAERVARHLEFERRGPVATPA